jgi:hypothetical protein
MGGSMSRSFFYPILVTFALVGCSSDKKTADAAAASGTGFGVEITDAKKIAEIARFEHEVSNESRRYIEGKVTYNQNSGNTVCSTDLTKEQDLSIIRENEFKIVNLYIQSIPKEFEPNPAFDELLKISEAAPGVVSAIGLFIPVATEAKLLLDTAIAFGKVGYSQYVAIHVAQKARRLDISFSETISRISTGLVTFENETNARLKLWEECEYQKLSFMWKQQNASIVEYEKRYSDFVRLRNQLRSNIQDISEINKKADELKKSHTSLFSRKLDIEALKNECIRLKDIGKSFQALILASDKYSDAVKKEKLSKLIANN